MTRRFRITVRGMGVELRGRMDELTDEDAPTLAQFAEAMKPFGLVIASPAEDDYDPFSGRATAETSLGQIVSMLAQQEYPNLPDLIRMMAEVHYMQANVIQGERALRESAEAELRDRELHHFETEQMIDKIKAARSNHPECDKHDENDPVTCGWKRAVQDIDKVLQEHERPSATPPVIHPPGSVQRGTGES